MQVYVYAFHLQHACLRFVNCRLSYIKVIISTVGKVTDIVWFVL